jgi:hypothetical protein
MVLFVYFLVTGFSVLITHLRKTPAAWHAIFVLDTGNRWSLSPFSSSENMKLSGMGERTLLNTHAPVNEGIKHSGVVSMVGSHIGNERMLECHFFVPYPERQSK